MKCVLCNPLIVANILPLHQRLYNYDMEVALIPILCRALEQVAKFLRRNFSRSTIYIKYLEDPCVWVESNTTTLNTLVTTTLNISLEKEQSKGFLNSRNKNK